MLLTPVRSKLRTLRNGLETTERYCTWTRLGRWLKEEGQGNHYRNRWKELQELKILGVIFNENPCNWDTQFDSMLSKASARMYILRVCKYYGYSICEVHQLFSSLIMLTFLYGIEVWEVLTKANILRESTNFSSEPSGLAISVSALHSKTL